MDQPTAGDLLTQLERLVGTWSVESRWPGDDEPWPGGGRTTFEWHDSRQHLVQRSTVELPEAPDSVSIIGCDAANSTWFQLYTDERGVCRVYEMSIDEREWKLWRSGQPFDQRFSVVLDDDGTTMTGSWDRVDNGAFVVDFEQTFRRVARSLDSTGPRRIA